jgi:hypothetical protein
MKKTLAYLLATILCFSMVVTVIVANADTGDSGVYNAKAELSAMLDTLTVPNDGTESKADFCEILRLLEVALNKAASPDDPKAAATIRAAMEEALELAEQMQVRYKEKQTTTRRAVIFLRCADDGWFFPLLQVYGSEGVLLFETDLPKTIDLMSLGEIQVSAKRVTVKPRQNAIAEYLGLKPITFNY